MVGGEKRCIASHASHASGGLYEQAPDAHVCNDDIDFGAAGLYVLAAQVIGATAVAALAFRRCKPFVHKPSKMATSIGSSNWAKDFLTQALRGFFWGIRSRRSCSPLTFWGWILPVFPQTV